MKRTRNIVFAGTVVLASFVALMGVAGATAKAAVIKADLTALAKAALSVGIDTTKGDSLATIAKAQAAEEAAYAKLQAALKSASAKPTLIYTAKGSGQANTPMFRVPAGSSEWQVNWSHNCRPIASQGNGGFFDWQVNTPLGQDNNDNLDTPDINAISGSGAERYNDTGGFSLAITTFPGCIWSVAVYAS